MSVSITYCIIIIIIISIITRFTGSTVALHYGKAHEQN